jgi:hypothetical protein
MEAINSEKLLLKYKISIRQIWLKFKKLKNA